MLIVVTLSLELAIGSLALPVVHAQAKTCRVNTNTLNVRQGPGTDYARIAQWSRGTVVTMTHRNSAATWLFGNGPGFTGWLSAQYLVCSFSTQTLPVDANRVGTRTDAASGGAGQGSDVGASAPIAPGGTVISGPLPLPSGTPIKLPTVVPLLPTVPIVPEPPVADTPIAPPAVSATPTRTPTPEPADTPTPPLSSADLPQDVVDLLYEWDRVHHASDFYLDASELPQVLTGPLLAEQTEDIQTLRDNNCYWEFTDQMTPKIVDWWQPGAGEFYVTQLKRWQGLLYCNGVLDEATSYDSTFYVTYRIVWDGGWRIADRLSVEVVE
jgi:uncharacterized protein YraI